MSDLLRVDISLDRGGYFRRPIGITVSAGVMQNIVQAIMSFPHFSNRLPSLP